MRVWRTLLAVLAIMLLPVSGAQARDVLRIALPLEPPNLDATSGAAVAVDQVTYHTIYEGLVTLAADGTVKPLLATRWTVSDDGLVYSFHLRDGVRFQDGTPFDAKAVVFSLTRAAAPDSTNVQKQALSNIARIDVTGPLDVRIVLKQQDADFLTLLSYGDAVMVSPRSAATLASAPVGTGPFRFADWRRGDALTLRRDPHYWGAAPHLRTLVFRFIVDPTAAYAAVKAHDVDLFLDYPAPETLAQLRSDPTLKVFAGPTDGEVILAFNQRSGPLADVRVRRAITQGIDRRAILNGAMYGYGTPIGSHFPPQSPDYVDLTGLYPHDEAAARRLLAQAGYPDGLSLTLKLPPPPYARRGGEIIASELARIGVRVTLRNLEWAQWLDEVYTRHDFELTIVNHAEPFDYDIYGRPDYYFGYHSAAYNTLLADLKRTSDPAARRALFGEVQRRLADDAANGFLFQYPRLGVQDAALSDIWINTPNEALNFATAHFGDSAGDAAGEGGEVAAGGGRAMRYGVIAALIAGLAYAVWRLGPGYVAGRAGSLLATFMVATVVIFALVQVVPGDPAAFMMGMNASPEAVAALHAQLGLEGAAPARYLAWLGGLAHGDFGISYTYRVPVAGLIAERLAVSLPLALMATALSILIGVPAGYLAARKRGGLADVTLGWLARFGIAMPSFWLAILLVLLFSVVLRWFGAGGFPGWEAGMGPALRALTLPTIALGLPQAAILARVTRASLMETMAEDYVRTARAKGLSLDAALRRHALPNALAPVLTVLGLQVPFLLAGSAIIETIFFLPGLGRLVLQAITQRDLIVVQSVVVLLVAASVLASFIVDMLQSAIDPRLRHRSART
ncbi:MAG: ABC transporter substrate-binding protein [Sphingobium sp.]|nr:MAG: ABC transporter substrate-binding protein [Sphingobium sp.]